MKQYYISKYMLVLNFKLKKVYFVKKNIYIISNISNFLLCV